MAKRYRIMWRRGGANRVAPEMQGRYRWMAIVLGGRFA
tara:strand:+ start:105 stop:218 length:114 start_codon:yes stop_codon:yes gene_type:complete